MFAEYPIVASVVIACAGAPNDGIPAPASIAVHKIVIRCK